MWLKKLLGIKIKVPVLKIRWELKGTKVRKTVIHTFYRPDGNHIIKDVSVVVPQEQVPKKIWDAIKLGPLEVEETQDTVL